MGIALLFSALGVSQVPALQAFSRDHRTFSVVCACSCASSGSSSTTWRSCRRWRPSCRRTRVLTRRARTRRRPSPATTRRATTPPAPPRPPSLRPRNTRSTRYVLVQETHQTVFPCLLFLFTKSMGGKIKTDVCPVIKPIVLMKKQHGGKSRFGVLAVLLSACRASVTLSHCLRLCRRRQPKKMDACSVDGRADVTVTIILVNPGVLDCLNKTRCFHASSSSSRSRTTQSDGFVAALWRHIFVVVFVVSW